jgi:hypothetical protein
MSEATPACSTKEKLVLVRANDVVAGIIAGAVCAVLAAAFEAGVVAFRFFSIGHFGTHLVSGVLLLAVVGGVMGGLVGLTVGTLFGTREVRSRVRAR